MADGDDPLYDRGIANLFPGFVKTQAAIRGNDLLAQQVRQMTLANQGMEMKNLQTQRAMDIQQKLQQAMAQLHGGTEATGDPMQDQINNLSFQAEFAKANGQTEEYRKIEDTISKIRIRDAAVKRIQYNHTIQESTQHLKDLRALAQAMDPKLIGDQKAFDAAIDQVEATIGHEIQWPEGHRPAYSESHVKMIRAFALSGAEQNKEARDAAEDADKRLTRAVERDRARAMTEYYKERAKNYEADLETKAGKQRDVKSPSTVEQRRALDYVKSHYPDMESDAATKEAARSLALSAKKIQKTVPNAQDFNIALGLAAKEYEDKGDFIRTDKDKLRFLTGGEDENHPANLPPGANIPDDPKEAAKWVRKNLVEGKWYTWPNGRVGQLTKKGILFTDDTPPDEEERMKEDEDLVKEVKDLTDDEDDRDEDHD